MSLSKETDLFQDMGRGQTEHSLKEDGEEEEGREPVLTDLSTKQGGEAV